MTLERDGALALIRIDNPPVNALGTDVRRSLWRVFEALRDDPPGAAVLYGAGRVLFAGADIREFGKPPQDPKLTELCDLIEASPFPVAAVVHGPTLGGGLEVAMAAHARVALPGARVGLPEVLLGIIPGAGGTQRAPRLAGIGAALDMVTTGRHLPVEEALALGLVDRMDEGTPEEAARRAGAAIVAGDLPTRRTGEIAVAPDPGAVAAVIEEMRAAHPHLLSPMKAAEAVGHACEPIAEGLAAERRLYLECHDSPQRAGLVHAFFAEREAAKFPESAEPRPVSRVGVVGGGTMGSGIATAALLAGLDVTMVERDAAGLARGHEAVGRNLDGAVRRGKLDAADRAARGDFRRGTDMALLADADLVIEAAFEDMDVKREIFARLDAACRPGAVLATNTSYLDVNEIASATARPEEVVGLHFFSPAHVMRLLEVVVADRTAPDVVTTALALARRMGKVPVRAGVCDGFIGNRVMTHYRKAADHVVDDGADPAQVDAAMEGFGFAMGPFAVADLAGLDIGHAARMRRAPARDPAERYPAFPDAVVEAGMLGRKTGAGYYLYEGRDRRPNPEALAIIEARRTARRTFDDEEIVSRIMTAMASEGARAVEEGIARRPVDVDAVMLFGYGFPRFRGGPMLWADMEGPAALAARIEGWAAEDPQYWQVPDLLRRLAETGGTFAEMNRWT